MEEEVTRNTTSGQCKGAWNEDDMKERTLNNRMNLKRLNEMTPGYGLLSNT